MALITGIRIKNFRSIADSGMIPINKEKNIILIGENGAGKTAILDSLDLIMNSNTHIEPNSTFNYMINKKCEISLFFKDFQIKILKVL